MASAMKELEELAEVISIAIARERASIEFYTNAYNKAVSENARRVFSLLLEQERKHEVDLRSQLHEVRAEIEAARLKRGKNKD